MSARSEILGRVKAGLGKGDREARRAAALMRLSQPSLGPQPLECGDLKTRFITKAESLASTQESVRTLSDVPNAVARYVSALDLSEVAMVCSPDLAELPWIGSGLQPAFRGAQGSDQVGVTGCFCALAETGTLLLLSSPDTPATVSLLPETHIAIVPVSRIVFGMEEAFALVRHERGALPRALNFVSGPSRTGDIEQTIVLGAHGPCRVHLILVDA